VIRWAIASDAADLADVHISTWRSAYRDIVPAEFLAALEPDRRTDWWHRHLDEGARVHVVDEGGILGFCEPTLSDDPDWGEILTIYVHPDHWGRGLGRRLLTAGEQTLRQEGLNRALLWVFEANRAARSFYEKMGWRQGKPIHLLDLGGRQLTEVRYERDLRGDR
jgi:GNAT superfamily N-acetyltransferase